MNKPFDMVLMVGIPGSGKTTFCRERLFPSHLYISLDQLRTRSAEAELFDLISLLRSSYRNLRFNQTQIPCLPLPLVEKKHIGCITISRDY